ncbi:MAG: hypothetical protein ABIV94_03010 [Acidimicrobiales bacterium]
MSATDTTMPSRLDRLAELVAQLTGCHLERARDLIGREDAPEADDELEVVAWAMVRLRHSPAEPSIDLRDESARPADAHERR